MPVHSAPARPFATCSAHDQSSGSDFSNQYAMTLRPPSPGSRGQHRVCTPTVADLARVVDPRALACASMLPSRHSSGAWALARRLADAMRLRYQETRISQGGLRAGRQRRATEVGVAGTWARDLTPKGWIDPARDAWG